MVGQIIIVYNKSVIYFLDELTHTLYKKNYFSYIETAEEYVTKIKEEVKNKIHVIKHHDSPEQLIRYGKYYIKVRGSQRTMWYVFFNKKDNRYVIKYIINNHVATAAFLKGL